MEKTAIPYEAFPGANRTLLEKFWEYHTNNPQIYELFARYSHDAKNAGWSCISHWLIINRVRWSRTVEVRTKDFKISNDFIAFYPRLLIYNEPIFDGFFTLRKLDPHRTTHIKITPLDPNFLQPASAIDSQFADDNEWRERE